MLRSALKAAPLPSLISREEVPEVTNIPLSTSGDEKMVTIVNTAEPEKKKRKLKKPDVVVPNEPNKEGMVENAD
jgi:hypothetical protein